MGTADAGEGFGFGGSGPVTGTIFVTGTRFRGVVGEAASKALQFEAQVYKADHLINGEFAAAGIGGAAEPFVGSLKDFLGEVEFLKAEVIEGGLARGGMVENTVLQGFLGGLGKGGFEGPDATAPVVLGGKAADGAEAKFGVPSHGWKGAAAFKPEVAGESREVGGRLTGLAFPEGHGSERGLLISNCRLSWRR